MRGRLFYADRLAARYVLRRTGVSRPTPGHLYQVVYRMADVPTEQLVRPCGHAQSVFGTGRSCRACEQRAATGVRKED